MDKIKQVLTPGKHHDTTIESEIKPEVTHEHVRPTERQEITQEVLREHDVHHHQARVQPLQDQQVLPTEHRQERMQTEHRHLETPMDERDASRFQQNTATLSDQRHVAPVERTTVEGETRAAEMTHHHIHETIQPVIQRETIAPSVIHTTQKVHEHITDKPIVHDRTIEPAMSVSEFKQKVEGLGTGAGAGITSSHHDGMKPNVVPSSQAGAGVADSTGAGVGSETGTGTGTGTRSGSGGSGYGTGTGTGTTGRSGDGLSGTGSGKTGGAVDRAERGAEGGVEAGLASETNRRF